MANAAGIANSWFWRQVSRSMCADKRPMVTWIEADRANFAGTVKGLPVRDELNEPAIREQYVVEYYSR